MSPEQLLKHFEQIAEAPDAIPRLRQFILDLAVRGKLVDQDPKNESAIAFIKRIQEEKERLALEGKYKGITRISLIQDDDIPYQIPPNWAWVRFGAITISRDGERIPVSKEERSQRAKIYDYYGASGVIDKIDGFLFDKPLLLIGEDGANLINRSTPIAFIARGKYWVNNHAHVLDGISEEFLRFIELHINAIDLKPYVTGTAQPKMNQAKMNNIAIALPPEAEQHRIVAKVDELMALCDELEAARTKRESRRDRLVAATLHALNNGDAIPDSDATPSFQESARFYFNHLPRLTTRPEHIKQLRQTILNLAVRGKLVPQNPIDEPVLNLLDRIKKIRVALIKAGSIKDCQDISPVTKAETPYEIPQNWQWVRVSEVADSRLGKMLDKAKNKGSLYRYLRNVNVRWFDFDLSDVYEMRFEESELDEFSLQIGDVLICEGGEPGRSAVWDGRESNIYFQKAIHRVRLFGAIVPHFFVNNLRHDAVSGRLEEFFTGVGIKHFTGKGLARYSFPLPPLAEQHRIVAKVDELMALCDELETRLTDSDATHRRLLEATLHEALKTNPIVSYSGS